MDNEKGVWRTVRGRRIFIREGESLGSAMSRSGKFKREDIRESKTQLRRVDRAEKTLQKPDNAKLRRKMSNKGNRYERDVFEDRQAEKNRINENAHIEGSGKTRVQRNWNKYSDEQRREARHEIIQKKLADYKAKKQSNNKIEKFVKKDNTYIPIRKGEDEKEVLANYKNRNNKDTMKSIKEAQHNERFLQDGIRLELGEEGEKEVIDAQKRRGKLIDYAVKNKGQVEKYVSEYEKNKEKIDNKILNHESLTGSEYLGYLASDPKEGDIILAGGKNGEDIRIGKNGKLEKIADYKAKKQSNVRDYKQEQKDLLNDMSKLSDEQLKEYRDIFKEQGKNKFVERIDKHLESRKQSNNKIETSKKDKNDWLPKATEIKEQGTSNRKEVSDNIQAHILEYYSPDFTGDDIPAEKAFVDQMDAMSWLPTNWKRGEEIAKGGSYLIYNQDMAEFLDSLKINPKGKKFSDDKAFQMYTSLIGRESERLYNKIKKHEQETIDAYKKRKGK